MINKNFQDTLELISKKLNKENIRWMIVGSTNLSLQGIDISPKDLDIVVDFKNLTQIEKFFGGFLVSRIEEMDSKVNIPWWRVKLLINQIPVEIIGEKENGIYSKKIDKITEISFNNIKIPCLKLTSEMEAYQETNRQEKVDLIKGFLNKVK